ncbi:MAG: DUF2249 domain-containing protein [Chloroflexi bacterium]|nr:DUF2249 domain-containing protein [Chloroflexota bacterium]
MSKRQYIAIGVDKERKIWTGHFGMAPIYYIYDENGEMVDQRVNPYGAGGGQKKHHDNPQLIADLLPDCKVFIARRMGGGSKQKLVAGLGITPILTTERYPDGALRAYLAADNEIAPLKPDWVTEMAFETVDARQLSGFFLPEILSRARTVSPGMGFEVIQSFEPVPLYQTLADLGWDEHFTEKTADNEYRVYFRRSGQQKSGDDLSIGLQPAASAPLAAPLLVSAATRVPIVLQSATPAPAPVIYRMLQSERLQTRLKVTDLKIWEETEKHLSWVVRNKADITFTAVLAAVKVFAKKKDIRLASVDIWDNFYILTRGYKANSFADLHGRTIYLPLFKNAPPMKVTAQLLRELGENMDNFIFKFGKPFGRPPEIAQKLIDGEIDTALLREPEAGYALASSDDIYQAVSYGGLWKELYPSSQGLPNAGVLFKESLLREHPDLARLFLTEMADAIDWVKANPDEAAELSYERMGRSLAETRNFIERINFKHVRAETAVSEIQSYIEMVEGTRKFSLDEMLPLFNLGLEE